MKKRIVIGSLLGLILALAVAAPALAFPAHGHILTTPAGETHVAPATCDHEDGANHVAFHNFHSNVHKDAPGLDRGGPVSIDSHDCD